MDSFSVTKNPGLPLRPPIDGEYVIHGISLMPSALCTQCIILPDCVDQRRTLPSLPTT